MPVEEMGIVAKIVMAILFLISRGKTPMPR
jgi:hypothetical protein